MTQSVQINSTVQDFIERLYAKWYPPLWWPRFLFHYSDIANAVSILREGRLLSRDRAKQGNLLKTDSAGQAILANTASEYFNYVRLYFRPRTPPLYHVEGFSPQDNQVSAFQAHCPVPIYFLFDAAGVLSLPNVQFSSGNLASPSSHLYSHPEDLAQLDFDTIYHNSAILDPMAKERIIKLRCSEVIVPDALSLEAHLRSIVCRSAAERETLLNMLPPDVAGRWRNVVIWNSTCFFRNRFFVNQVELREKDVLIRYENPSPDRFEIHYTFQYSGRHYELTRRSPVPSFAFNSPPGDYSLAISVDKHAAYVGRYKSIDLPF